MNLVGKRYRLTLLLLQLGRTKNSSRPLTCC